MQSLRKIANIIGAAILIVAGMFLIIAGELWSFVAGVALILTSIWSVVSLFGDDVNEVSGVGISQNKQVESQISKDSVKRKKQYSVGILITYAILFIFDFAVFADKFGHVQLFLFFITLWLVVAFISISLADQAEKKGKNWEIFFWLSLLAGPIIMGIIVAVMSTEQSKVLSETKLCPKCAEVVKAEAILCKHCRSDIG